MSHHDHPNITDPRSTDEIIAAMHARAAAADAVRDANALCAKHLEILVQEWNGPDGWAALEQKLDAARKALATRAEAEARLLATFEKG